MVYAILIQDYIDQFLFIFLFVHYLFCLFIVLVQNAKPFFLLFIMFLFLESMPPILGMFALFKNEESSNRYSMFMERKSCEKRTAEAKNGTQTFTEHFMCFCYH